MMQPIIDEAESVLLHTYNRYPVVFDHGDGVKLYDTDGKEYLDFVCGIGVFALGYNNKTYNDALKAQIDKITHTSNYFYNVPAVNAAKATTNLAACGFTAPSASRALRTTSVEPPCCAKL